ncbi:MULTISPECIES: membrane protein insertion efficiency factor YidD [unclassified Pseudactinotalea]|uniref:membrane protein insertion efficiency factor YidD n=1 Tax=unclassified Pseudactinotalea TaxID=2649176 RepID=UPI00128B2851|nr:MULTISPECIES: membrane protein insertion efficiency factor YidD [unclassified Pseudactinotalea]MPV51433.1 membrane protein insertion efficiency factor YidD [Pseudactinotalea sp. HY160]QGH70841.1 membrane protein insertion efficiency factor YidD [Pseudactinotalea sp. HY158]
MTRRAVAMVSRGSSWLLVSLIRMYQAVVSPWFAPTCRYYPSCSAYAVTALRMHGPIKGFLAAGWRILRCNPWSAGGVDPVPERWPARRVSPGRLTRSTRHHRCAPPHAGY